MAKQDSLGSLIVNLATSNCSQALGAWPLGPSIRRIDLGNGSSELLERAAIKSVSELEMENG